ncbi:sugar ABC transporter ATP-binding protein [Natronococcus pandeyae]|uniref:ABC-type D-xylose/L-arabinose transporter n=1 Tax=Natronococcus pandeyae TaxID=2055836 RepID=A0A8J8PZT2_9EURY|nr:ABC transporter ATP-binding protein [Natronococcus pandeyae]TYL36169.1 sugar ABC transporter ATP-binding protein [Natronococcus pandeyae]
MTKIELDHVTKEYGSLVAVDDIAIEFTEGAYTMILGPSGCGKSTTLRMIAGLETPTRGDVLIDGEVVTDQPPRHRNLSMVFQSLALWNHKSVRENMGFGLQMEGVDKEERNARIEEIAAVLQIEDKLDQPPSELSGGQQQRVALGRSLVRKPEVILLDEPLSSLDEKLRLEMRTELARIQQELGTTFVHVTHNQEDAMTIADEILLLNEGEVQQFGPSLDLYHEPDNEFVADFIGSPSINLFDANIVENGAVRLDAGGISLDLPERHRDQYLSVPRSDVRVGVRPESMYLGDDGESGWPAFSATVDVVETFGDYNWYYLQSDLEESLVSQSANVNVMNSLSRGDEVTVRVNPESVHLFDPKSGEAYF